MKILFFTENFPPETNAAATRVYERACYWVRWGHDVTVITSAPNFPQGRLYEGYQNKWHQSETNSGIRVIRVKTFIAPNRGVLFRTLDFLSFMVTGWVAGLLQEKPDVVVSTSPQFFAAVAGWLTGLVRRVPFVFELGDIWPASIVAVGAMKPSLPIRLIEKFELYLYRSSARVVALTPAFKDNLVQRDIDPGHIGIVINGVDLPRYSPLEKDAGLQNEWGLKDKFIIGYLGTHGMAHALMNVVEAAEGLKDNPEIQFLLVGDGAERQQLLEAARSRGLDNIHFMPPQPKEAMPKVWSLCDVALVHLKNSPVFAEVIPSKMFEAMAMGLPVLLAAPEGEASRIVTEYSIGLHVPPEEPGSLTDAVLTFMEDKVYYGQCAENALNKAPLHSREKQAEKMIEEIKKAVGGSDGISR
ncbi:MAG: glycosyltransferase family 4 protein [Rhodospirillales bacterium]|nr:glycosyltransferase family 4 protein [Rhodospirillales bacterium]